MNNNDSILKSFDDHEIFYRTWATSDAKPKGLIHIIHGMAEHSERYHDSATALADAGFHVVAHDHRGHGYSAKTEDLGHFANRAGWEKAVEDIRVMENHLKSTFPNLPRIILGHSMGSFLSLNYVETLNSRDCAGLDALILSGSTYNSILTNASLNLVTRIERKRQGKKGKSPIIEELTFGKFNREFKPNRTESDWLTRDEAQVDKYIRDPLSGFRCTNQLWYELTRALLKIHKQCQLRKIPKDLPIHLIYGDLDPLGGKSGNKALRKRFRSANIKKITEKGYANARHEILNEINRSDVIQDLIHWLNRKFSS